MVNCTGPIVARSRALANVMSMVQKVARSTCTVLITGETGTGKELVARAIHDSSSLRAGPFIPINVAAIPGDLVESNLFGHRKGAFTGATEGREGVFRAASQGTLLLDEIGELPSDVQPKLLRAIEHREVLPVGCDAPVPVKTRLIASTCRNLDAMVDDREFRQDLLYRLNTVTIEVPPLRERPEDIPILIDYYSDKFSREHGRTPLQFDQDAKRHLLEYHWPGNIRELSHVIERAVLLSDGELITAGELSERVLRSPGSPSLNLEEVVESCKRRHIMNVLECVDGNRGDAARALGISQATLFRYIDHFSLRGYALNGKAGGKSH